MELLASDLINHIRLDSGNEHPANHRGHGSTHSSGHGLANGARPPTLPTHRIRAGGNSGGRENHAAGALAGQAPSR